MKKRILALFIAALLLTGCSWMDGSYVYVEPHQQQTVENQTDLVSASTYPELMTVMENLVTRGTQSYVINVAGYDQDVVEGNMELVSRYIREDHPIGAYAVEEISFQLGTNNGQPAVAVEITYRRTTMEIRQIRKLQDMDAVCRAIHAALESHSARVVVLAERYEDTDFEQVVRDYAAENPNRIMEVPQISEGIYGDGVGRVIELNFTYQNSRESLRQMQNQVRPVFEAAALYVSGEGSEHQKFAQLSSFLTERFPYTIETSITPSYSLLCHGVGDSRAFAQVYACICRQAGLECMVVSGTRDGEPWSWNIILDNGIYYHVDLLKNSQGDIFRVYCDQEMAGYVWDYSAYPACEAYYQAIVTPPPAAETTPPEQTEPTQETEPETEPAPQGEE